MRHSPNGRPACSKTAGILEEVFVTSQLSEVCPTGADRHSTQGVWPLWMKNSPPFRKGPELLSPPLPSGDSLVRPFMVEVKSVSHTC